MKKVLLLIFLVGVGLVGFLKYGTDQAKNPSEKKKEYARNWVNALASCSSLCDITNRFIFVDVTGEKLLRMPNRFTDLVLRVFTNGDWMVLHACDSHTDPNGGIMVTKDNKGAVRVFYGHVCGEETIFGDSLERAYRRYEGPGFDRREVFLDGKRLKNDKGDTPSPHSPSAR